MTVHATLNVEVVTSLADIEAAESPMGKPFIRLSTSDGTILEITLNLAEMLGGVGRGANSRFGFSKEP